MAERQHAVSIERRQIVDEDLPERLRHRGWLEKFVLDDIGVLEEHRDRREQSVVRIELTDVQPIRLSGDESSELIVIERVVGLVPRYVLLEQPEAVGVDGPNEQATDEVERSLPETLLDPTADPILQLLGCLLSEGESDDASRRNSVRE